MEDKYNTNYSFGKYKMMGRKKVERRKIEGRYIQGTSKQAGRYGEEFIPNRSLEILPYIMFR